MTTDRRKRPVHDGLRRALLSIGMALGLSSAWALDPGQEGEVLSTAFGITTASADNTEAINRWLAHCNAKKAVCRLAAAESGAIYACGIVVPGPNVILQGPGMGGVKLTATAKCDRDFITVAVAPASTVRPAIRDLWIHCANTRNTKGHCIYLPDDTQNSYGVGIDLVNVYVDRAAEDALHVGRNRGAGMLMNTFLYHYRRTGLHLESSDWNCIASNFSGNYAPGEFADFGVRIVAGSNSTFVNCRSYMNKIGISAEYNRAATPLTWIGGDLSANSRHGARIDSHGRTQGVVISGTRFTENSQESSNTYSDILLVGNSGAVISNNMFQKGGKSVPRYLIETVSPFGPVIVAGNQWNGTHPQYQPFGTAVTNDFANVPMPATDSGFVCSTGPGTYANRWSLSCGYGSNASGKYATAIGRQSTAAADHAVALGAGSVLRRPAMAYSNASFSTPGDVQAIVVDMLTAVSTDAKGVRLTADRQPASASNTLNLGSDFRKLILRDITITASDPQSADVASWTLSSLILTRGKGSRSVAIVGAPPQLVRIGATEALVSLRDPGLEADPVNAGLAVTAYGLPQRALRWVLSARAIELQ
jgi:hypothetical protein